jgi:peptidoglycan/LPS O-acetylase OafA/YrhL
MSRGNRAERASGTHTWSEYQSRRYFPALDGMRAISVIMVITVHVPGRFWQAFAFHQGVIVFFVISGFLITTLLLREERSKGTVSFRGFYLRRAFRILPLYYLVLAAYIGFILVLNLSPGDRTSLHAALPHYLTYTNEFANSNAPFGQSWSLAIEEKFYLLWPALMFALLAGRPRYRIAAVTILVLGLAAVHGAGVGPHWINGYAAILLGCLLAFLLDNPRSYERLRALGERRFVWVGVGFFAVVQAAGTWRPDSYLITAAFPLPVALLMTSLLVANPRGLAFLGSRPLVHVGKRSYGIYLVHTMVLSVLEKAMGGAGDPTVVLALALFVLGTALSLGVADVLHRLVEQPLIDQGRRLGSRKREPPPQPATLLPAAVPVAPS